MKNAQGEGHTVRCLAAILVSVFCVAPSPMLSKAFGQKAANGLETRIADTNSASRMAGPPASVTSLPVRFPSNTPAVTVKNSPTTENGDVALHASSGWALSEQGLSKMAVAASTRNSALSLLPAATGLQHEQSAGIRASSVSSAALSSSQARISSASDITVTKMSDLFFGTAVIGLQCGTIIVSPSGSAKATGSVILKPDVDESAAVFRYALSDLDCTRPDSGRPRSENHTRETEQPLSIVLPDHIYLKRVGGTESMLVDNFTDCVENSSISIGATLHLTPNQPSGLYNGTYPIIINH